MRLTIKFWLGTFFLLTVLALELGYLSVQTIDDKSKQVLLKLSGVTDPAFHSNIPYLRHRSTSGVGELYFLHPGLREVARGTFVQSPSFSNEHP